MGAKLDALIKEMNKKADDTIISKGLTEYEYDRIPFSSPRMNYCTYGGLPVGKIVEFYGKFHSGKTTSALDIIANYQAREDARDVVYIDAENSLDVVWARKIGVIVEDMYILQPKEQSAEEIFQQIVDLVSTGEVGLWVLDSIGALMSQQAWDKELTDKTYAGVSKPLTEFGQKMVQLNHKHKCLGIGINQERDKLTGYGGTTTPGGNAWKHFCMVRMQFSQGDYLDEKGNKLPRGAENPAGNVVLMSMTKNKTCAPNRRVGFYTINYLHGIDYMKDLVDVAIRYGIIDKHGAWFTIIDTESGEILKDKIQGQSKVYEALESNDELLDRVEQLVNIAMEADA